MRSLVGFLRIEFAQQLGAADLLEPSADVLRQMVLFIDLSPVRAGWVERPQNYAWSGFAAAKHIRHYSSVITSHSDVSDVQLF